MNDKAIEKSAFNLANDIQTIYNLEIGVVPDIEKMIMDEFRQFRLPSQISWPDKKIVCRSAWHGMNWGNKKFHPVAQSCPQCHRFYDIHGMDANASYNAAIDACKSAVKSKGSELMDINKMTEAKGMLTFEVKNDERGHTAKVILEDGNFIQFKYFSEPSILMAYVVAWAVQYFHTPEGLTQEDIAEIINSHVPFIFPDDINNLSDAIHAAQERKGKPCLAS